jgi:hypothetical protein
MRGAHEIGFVNTSSWSPSCVARVRDGREDRRQRRQVRRARDTSTEMAVPRAAGAPESVYRSEDAQEGRAFREKRNRNGRDGDRVAAEAARHSRRSRCSIAS